MAEPRKRPHELHTFHAAPHFCHHPLDEGQQIVAVEKRGLDVDLRELGLTITPQILVAEASNDLEVAFEPRHHQQLLEQLWGLRKRVEAARLEPARDQEVAGALGSRPGEKWSLHLQESLRMEVVAHSATDEIPDLKRPERRGPSHVEVAVLEAKRLLHLRVTFDIELEG